MFRQKLAKPVRPVILCTVRGRLAASFYHVDNLNIWERAARARRPVLVAEGAPGNERVASIAFDQGGHSLLRRVSTICWSSVSDVACTWMRRTVSRILRIERFPIAAQCDGRGFAHLKPRFAQFCNSTLQCNIGSGNGSIRMACLREVCERGPRRSWMRSHTRK